MRVRRRILIIVLALAVIATVIVIACTPGDKGVPPRVSFAASGFTNDEPKFAIVSITNREGCAVSLNGWHVQPEGKMDLKRSVTVPGPIKLRGGQSCTMLLELPAYHGRLDPPERWRITAIAMRETFSNRLRRRMKGLPLIGPRIEQPRDYRIVSELFAQ